MVPMASLFASVCCCYCLMAVFVVGVASLAVFVVNVFDVVVAFAIFFYF